jgi:regulatory protein
MRRAPRDLEPDEEREGEGAPREARGGRGGAVRGSAGRGSSGRDSGGRGTGGRGSSGRDSGGREGKKEKEPLTEAGLAEAALNYLNRYDASFQGLRRVLLRKIARDGDRAKLTEKEVDELLLRLEGSRVIDDQRYAENLTANLRSRGASSRKIAMKLRERGIQANDADKARETDRVSDLEAARTYARKRRLASRYNLEDPAERQKALAALARQGFSFEVAVRALAPVEEE